MHCALPVVGEKKPAGQAKQVVAPAAEKLPGWHAAQPPAVASKYWPASHACTEQQPSQRAALDDRMRAQRTPSGGWRAGGRRATRSSLPALHPPAAAAGGPAPAAHASRACVAGSRGALLWSWILQVHSLLLLSSPSAKGDRRAEQGRHTGPPQASPGSASRRLQLIATSACGAAKAANAGNNDDPAVDMEVRAG